MLPQRYGRVTGAPGSKTGVAAGEAEHEVRRWAPALPCGPVLLAADIVGHVVAGAAATADVLIGCGSGSAAALRFPPRSPTDSRARSPWPESSAPLARR